MLVCWVNPTDMLYAAMFSETAECGIYFNRNSFQLAHLSNSEHTNQLNIYASVCVLQGFFFFTKFAWFIKAMFIFFQDMSSYFISASSSIWFMVSFFNKLILVTLNCSVHTEYYTLDSPCVL